MTHAHTTDIGPHGNGDGLRVCVYYRMSSDEQALSIAQQQAEVRRYCAQRGWIIVAEYVDSGKSGSKDIEKRKAFHQLIADAKRGQWQAVVCYDTSRFGRLDSMTGAPFKNELRKIGVYLETVKDGRLDWSTSMGRLTDALLSEKNHEYSVSLSNAVVRGRTSIFQAGYWPVGEIPIGYDRELVENGQVQMVLPRTKKFAKPRNWHTRLKVNEVEAQAIRDLFKRFGSTDISLRTLSGELNRDKVAGPRIWTPQILSGVFRQPAYIGKVAIGRGRKVKEVHNRIEEGIIDNACPAIVPVALYNKVNEKLSERKKRYSNTSQQRSGSLSGILICGHCGYRMDKRERGGVVYYVCSSANRRQHLGCKQWSARESELEVLLASELRIGLNAAKLQQLSIGTPTERKSEVETLRADVDKLTKQYERARSNLLMADAEVFPILQKDVLRLKSELDQLRNTLTLADSAKGPEGTAEIVAWLESLDGTLRTIETPTTEPDAESSWVDTGPITTTAERLRDVLKSLNATLTLHWSPVGDTRYHQLTTGVLRAEGVQEPKTLAFSDATAASDIPSEHSSSSTRGRSRGRG